METKGIGVIDQCPVLESAMAPSCLIPWPLPQWGRGWNTSKAKMLFLVWSLTETYCPHDYKPEASIILCPKAWWLKEDKGSVKGKRVTNYYLDKTNLNQREKKKHMEEIKFVCSYKL